MTLKSVLAFVGVMASLTAATTVHAAHPHVAQVATPLTPIELLDALEEGHYRVFGQAPGTARLAMAWGQVAFENAQGAAVFNHNLGNVVARNSTQAVFRNKGDNNYYRAFDSVVDGAIAYWSVVSRCWPAFRMFDVGAAAAASAGLKACGYYEADVDVYSRALGSLYRYARANVIPERERDERRRTELTEACDSELVRLIELAATTRATFTDVVADR